MSRPDPLAATRRQLFWAKEALMGRDSRRVLQQVLADEQLSPTQRRAKQWAALQAVVRRAGREVPLYRQAWHGVDLDTALVSPEAFAAHVPILERAQLAGAGTSIIAEGDGRRRIVVAHTSGSTNSRMSLYSDRRGSSGSAAARLAAKRRWGLREGMREYRLVRRPWGGMMTPRQKLSYAARWTISRMTGVWSESAINTGPEDLASRCDDVRRFRASVLYGFGGALMTLADYVVRNRRQDDFRSLEAVIYIAEPVDQAGRMLLAEAFGAPVICDYTCNELGLLAYTCPDGGLHLNDDFCWFETVDDGGHPVVGEPGHLIVTNLSSSSTPLVRYRLGDLATLAGNDVDCACGAPQRMLASFGGREIDRIRRPDGTYIEPFAAANLIIPFHRVSHWYTRVSAGNRLGLVVEIPAAELAPHHDLVLREFQRYAGPSFACSVEAVDHIDPLPNGKYARVVREPGGEEGTHGA